MSERTMMEAELDFQVGLNISAICDFGFTNEANHTNHCAHFVGHMLGLRFGHKCAAGGVVLRVNEVYNRCANRGPWANKAVPLIYCMIFATQPSNMAHDGNMMNGPNKHMGIFRYPFVYNYSTMNHQVLKETVPDFLSRLDGVYNTTGSNPVQLFFGRELPV